MENKVPSADKILDLLEAFLTSDFKPMSVAEVMKKANLKRGSADRLLLVLKERGYVTSDKKKWFLTPKLVRFSEKYAEFCLNVIAKK